VSANQKTPISTQVTLGGEHALILYTLGFGKEPVFTKLKLVGAQV
tara:strand:- start:305 stop:439 length:135 start_codon:yes stop_codon:yes gene_type:complete